MHFEEHHSYTAADNAF